MPIKRGILSLEKRNNHFRVSAVKFVFLPHEDAGKPRRVGFQLHAIRGILQRLVQWLSMAFHDQDSAVGQREFVAGNRCDHNCIREGIVSIVALCDKN